MAVTAEPNVSERGVGIEVWNDEAELVCYNSRTVVRSVGCSCAFCVDRKTVQGSPAEFFTSPRSVLSGSREEGLRSGLRMEKKEVPEVRLAELSLSSLEKDTSCSVSPQTFRMKTSGQTKRPQLKCRSLLSLCIGMLGRHLEDIIGEIHIFTPSCPAPVKASLLAIARRRGLLSDELLVALADESWELLDVSGSDVTDASMLKVAKLCSRLQAVDISQCDRLSPLSVHSLVEHCPAIHTLRWGGTLLSNMTAKLSLGYILPKLNINEEAEDSWEELDTKPIGKGGQALRWLVWPSIDIKSRDRLEMECPRVVVNPQPFSRAFQLLSVPWEARPGIVLDGPSVEDVDPETWAIVTSAPRTPSQSYIGNTTPVLSVAERFKLAFIARDERLAPKRAKNIRQNQRRSEKAWLNSDTVAKSRAWAGLARKSLKGFDG